MFNDINTKSFTMIYRKFDIKSSRYYQICQKENYFIKKFIRFFVLLAMLYEFALLEVLCEILGHIDRNFLSILINLCENKQTRMQESKVRTHCDTVDK